MSSDDEPNMNENIEECGEGQEEEGQFDVVYASDAQKVGGNMLAVNIGGETVYIQDPDMEEDEEEEEEEEGQEERTVTMIPPTRDDARLVFTEHTKPVHTIATAWGTIGGKEGTWVATGGEDDICNVWNMETGEVVYRLEGHNETVIACDFTPDFAHIVTGGYDGTVKVWNTVDGSLQHTLSDLGNSVEWLTMHPKGPVCIAGSNQGAVCLWNCTKGQLMQCFMGHSDKVTCGIFTADGKHVITGSDDCSVRVFDPKTGESVFIFDATKNLPSEPVTSVVHSVRYPDVIYAGFIDGSIAMLSLKTGKRLQVLRAHDLSVEALACSESEVFSHYFASAGSDGHLCVWDINNPNCPRCKVKLGNTLSSVIWRDTQIICSSCEGRLFVRDGRLGANSPSIELQGHTDTIHCLVVAHTRPATPLIVLSSSDDNTVRVFAIPVSQP